MLDKSLSLDLVGFEKWLELSGVSHNTIKAYVSDIKLCLGIKSGVCTKEVLENYSLDDWREMICQLQEKNLTNRTCDRYLSSLRAFSKYKKSKGVLLELDKVRSAKRVSANFKMQSLDFESVQKFLVVFQNPKTFTEFRDCALVFLLYSVGLRINEALGLKWSDLFSRYILIRGKGDKIRYVPFFPFLKTILDNYRKHLSVEGDYIFVSNTQKTRLHACSVARKFREVSVLLGVSISPHSLRHACATHLLKSGCDIRYIQALLGHSSLEITKIYIDSSLDDLKNDYFRFV